VIIKSNYFLAIHHRCSLILQLYICSQIGWNFLPT